MKVNAGSELLLWKSEKSPMGDLLGMPEDKLSRFLL
jgi:hypothetical protein